MSSRTSLALAACVLAIGLAPPAFAQKQKQLLAGGDRPSEQQALAILDSYLSGHPRLNYVDCGKKGFLGEPIIGSNPIVDYKVTPESVVVTYACKEKRSLELKFADLPFVGQRNKELCVGTVVDAESNFAYFGWCMPGIVAAKGANGAMVAAPKGATGATFLDIKDF